jgi:Pro-kumamolisin, activation domain/Bacterial Ig-like domain (group 3)
MNRNPIDAHRSIQGTRPNWSAFIPVTIFLLAFFLCGQPLAAQIRQAQTPANQDAATQARVVPSRITQAVDETRLAVLQGNTYPLARAEFARGAAPPSLPMNRMMLVLKRSGEQELALTKLLDEQQDKSSPNYHKWLTPEQFGQQFGPSDQDILTVTSWLQSHGFQVAQVAKGRTVIEFSGTAAQVQEAFHTAINKYVVNGEEHWANASDPQIPAALTPVVFGPVSLHNFPRKPMHRTAGVFSRSKETGQVVPLFTGPSGPNQYFGVGPTDFAKIYNVQPLWDAGIDGTGQTIAIVAQSDIVVQDVRDFRILFGLPANDPVFTLNGPDPGLVPGDEDESILDVEWAGAVAKGASINMVTSQSTLSASGIDLSAVYVVDNNIAPVLSVSYGACEFGLALAGNQFFSGLWAQAATQGITVLVASGDNGSAGCDNPNTQTAARLGLAVSGIASPVSDVAVGGTDFDDVGSFSTYWNTTPGTMNSALSYIPETTWSDSCAENGLNGCTTVSSQGRDLVAAGGGPSNCWMSDGMNLSTCHGGYYKPAWQTGTGVPADSVRDIPDVSLFASSGHNGSFYVVCQADAPPTGPCSISHFLAVGGTSASVQAFAGIMALVNQKQVSLGNSERQGNANYVLYKLAAQAGNTCDSSASGTITNPACVFYDVTKPNANISVACVGGSPYCSRTTGGGFGILVDPLHTSIPAWTTGAGYDLATGLGTVNVANLANNWSSVTFTPTTISLTVNPLVSTHNSQITASVIVTSTSGAPTGVLSLVSDAASGAGIGAYGGIGIGPAGPNVSSGVGTTNLFPGGTYNVHAHYPGDGTFGASDSNAVSVTVNPESSKTAAVIVTFDPGTGRVANGNASTAAYGSPYILRVDVTNSAGSGCVDNTEHPVFSCPTGNVTLTDNGNPLNDFTIGGAPTNVVPLNSEGHLEDQPIQLSVGSHSILASYAGDNSFIGSSATDSISITKAATFSFVTPSSYTITSGGNVTLTATVSTMSSGVAPTGTVQFLNGSTPITGTVTYSPANGSASGPARLRATLTTTFSASLIQTTNVYYAAKRQNGSRWFFAASGLMLGFLILPGIPAKLRRRKGCFIASFLTLAVLSTSAIGCGGGGGTPPPTGHTLSISAQYSGDSNYTNSTAPPVAITVQ